MKPLEILKEYSEKKILQKIGRYVTKPRDAHITFFQEGHLYTVHCKLQGGDGFSCQVESKSEDKFSAIDQLVGKLEVQIKRHKEKIKSHRDQKTGQKFSRSQNQNQKPNNCDEVPIEAEDLIKYEKARNKAFG
jgi:ribosomal subunit interface protein